MFDMQELLQKSARQNEYYAPTPFWLSASDKLAQDFTNNDLTNFRSWPSCLDFFVPTYGFPGIALPKQYVENIRSSNDHLSTKQQQIVANFFNGQMHAQSDYRAFAAACPDNLLELKNFSESDIGQPVEHFCFDERTYSRSSLNYLNGLCFLAKHVDLKSIHRVLEIGGGFGALGEVLVKGLPWISQYIDVDIPPTCYFADYYLREIFGTDVVGDPPSLDDDSAINIENLNKIAVLPNWHIANLTGRIDLFVNFISFQEMEPGVVQNYLVHVDRLKPEYILLRNMREGKRKRDAQNPIGVDEPILSADYERFLPHYTLMATDAHIFGYTTPDGFHSELMLFERKG